MAIIKHVLPVLEYDGNPKAMIMPANENLELRLPPKVVFAFLGEAVDEYAAANHAKAAGLFASVTKNYPIYIVRHRGEKIGLCQAPSGAGAAVQMMDWLIGCGAEKIVSAASCEALVELPENAFLVPSRALRDEGISYHYLPSSRFVELDRKMLCAIRLVLMGRGIPFMECATWTTDNFFRETQEIINDRRKEGCAAVERECAALAACAQFRGVQFGELLFADGTPAFEKGRDSRGWGNASFQTALSLCLDVAANA